MKNVAPFDYSEAPHEWRHGPDGYDDYESYRPWLRDEFEFRCCYCLFRETWCVLMQMELDHFKPVKQEPSQSTEYENLRYACPRCNSTKAAGLLPCPAKSLLAKSVVVHANGTIEGKTRDAKKLIRDLRLDSPIYNKFRRSIIKLVALAKAHDDEVFLELMGYPADLPDLSRAKPPRNSRPAGIRNSAFARRASGRLPTIY